MGGRGASSGGGLSAGESAFASFSSGAGQRTVIAKTENGEYKLKISVNSPDSRIDTSSTEYRQALRDYNVKAKQMSDGSVVVQRGGLYQRKKTFKSSDDFKKDANKRIDSIKNRHEDEVKRLKSGRLTQIEAENFKSTIRSKTRADATKSIQRTITKHIQSERIRAEAGNDMKRRLARAFR